MRDAFVQPSGQDDNLGDSALRAGLLQALTIAGARLHVHLVGQTSDYVSGLPLVSDGTVYSDRGKWLRASEDVTRPVYISNAGEISPQADQPYPQPDRAREMQRFLQRDGLVIAAGIGLKDLTAGAAVRFAPVLRHAALVSWRDVGSRDAAGFGQVAPDWAFAQGSSTSAWEDQGNRPFTAVTLRFDRPWPDDSWIRAVRELARRTGTTIVTVAQVARDAPRAVRLAEVLGGRYLVSPSTRHDDLDRHMRDVYARSLAVVSDRAHALIMGATEGAYPLGTAADPQKIERILAAAGIGALTGHHDSIADRADRLDSERIGLEGAVQASRAEIYSLTVRIRAVFDL
ncbi:polysaccharide pyruvyl transferase family protein [Microbacterium foliorum]|uniref:Polysaccharide pyruvyl transferase family protein n=2 Tax=Microbacterium foliorum TaxID=104336 RepID=A0A4Y5YUV1_9MICO|nr:polysaccharide pyruvyl transferase family protein [Microbacterium foliorum]